MAEWTAFAFITVMWAASFPRCWIDPAFLALLLQVLINRRVEFPHGPASLKVAVYVRAARRVRESAWSISFQYVESLIDWPFGKQKNSVWNFRITWSSLRRKWRQFEQQRLFRFGTRRDTDSCEILGQISRIQIFTKFDIFILPVNRVNKINYQRGRSARIYRELLASKRLLQYVIHHR